jgi:hypothetical protein
MSTGRILMLGSESWTDKDRMICGLSDASARIPRDVKCRLVRNSYAPGAAKMAGDIWNDWVRTWPGQFDDAILLRPDQDITVGNVVAVLFSVGPPTGLLLHELNLLKLAGVAIMDYSIPESTEVAA